MIAKLFPYLLVILPIIGFFVDPYKIGNTSGDNTIHNLGIILFEIPAWAKIIAIIIGIGWIYSENNQKSSAINDSKNKKDNAGIR